MTRSTFGLVLFAALVLLPAHPLAAQCDDCVFPGDTRSGVYHPASNSGDNLAVSRNPAYHFWVSTRDMARIGHLMLNDGRVGRRAGAFARLGPANRRRRHAPRGVAVRRARDRDAGAVSVGGEG